MQKLIHRIDGPARDLATGSHSPTSASGPLSPVSTVSTLSRRAAAGGGRWLTAARSPFVLFALLLASLFLTSAPVEGQGLETFDNASIGTSYSDGSFVGNEGIEWSYVHSRDEATFAIAGKGIMLRRPAEQSSLSATIPGGIGNFSVDTRKAFTGNDQRALELVINGVVVQQFEPAFGSGGDSTIIPFVVTGINTEGDVSLELRVFGTGNQQIVLDNLAWTRYPAVGFSPPSVGGAFVTDIGQESAVVSSQVFSDGGAAVTARGFLYAATAENDAPTIGGTGVTDLLAGSGTGEFSLTLSGLDPETSYSVRSYATNSEGVTYSSIVAFSTAPVPPEPSAPPVLDGISPYTENFAEFVSAETIPTGWSVSNTAYLGDWGSGFSAGLRGNANVLGFQHTGGTGVFTTTVTVLNNTGETINALSISYLGKVARVAETRPPEWSVEVDGVAAPSLTYSTAAGVDQLISGGVANLNIPDGASFVISWSSERGGTGGSSRQIGITDLSVDVAVFNVEAPIFSVAPDLYFADQTVFVSNFGSFAPGTTVYYTMDGTEPTAASELYNNDSGILIPSSEPSVTLRAFAVNGSDLSPVTTATYEFPVSIADIATLRAQPTGATVYRLTNEATLIGQTAFRNTKIFQDDSGFGIQIDDSVGTITSSYDVGDNVLGLIGRLSIFQGQLQMVPVVDSGPAVSSGNEVVPLPRTLAELSFDDQSRLVVISDVVFTNGDGEILFGGGGAETPISDPSLVEGTTRIFRNVVGESDITDSPLPMDPVTITGFIQQNTRGLTLASRSLADIIEPPPIEGDGAGFASLSNVTSGSPYLGRRIFGSDEPQTLAIEVTVGSQSEALRAVSFTLPAGWTGLSGGNVGISGSGFQGASVSVSGNIVTVFNSELTEFAGGTVTIAGVNVPSPEDIEDYGNFSIEVATSIAGGELSAIKFSPRGYSVIPIEMLRAVDANGVPLAIGQTVAVNGVVTLEGFVVSGTVLAIYAQDETAGVFVSGGNLFDFDFIGRGEEFTFFGRVGVDRGLTRIEVQTNGGLTSTGFPGEPEPQILSINQALARAEALEGSLIRLQSLTRVGGTWPQSGGSANLTMRDPTGAELTLRINAPADISEYPEPEWPRDVIGVLGQFAQANPPFSGGYQIVPREYFDFVEATEIQLQGFEAWQDDVFFGTGITDPALIALGGDPDGDGVTNLLEYALGGDPLSDSRDLLPLLGVDAGGFLTLTFNRLVDGSDIVYLVDASGDLSSWTEIWSSADEPVVSAEPMVSQVVSDTVEADDSTARFLRLRVELQ